MKVFKNGKEQATTRFNLDELNTPEVERELKIEPSNRFSVSAFLEDWKANETISEEG